MVLDVCLPGITFPPFKLDDLAPLHAAPPNIIVRSSPPLSSSHTVAGVVVEHNELIDQTCHFGHRVKKYLPELSSLFLRFSPAPMNSLEVCFPCLWSPFEQKRTLSCYACFLMKFYDSTSMFAQSFLPL